MNFKEEQQKKADEIDQMIRGYLPAFEGEQKRIMEAMSYAVLAGGKRLRPMLLLETSRMFHGSDEVAKPFAAAIEMIHTYSLVHDDLPAMDNDDYRRGRKTTHVVYGEDMGILTGDALLNYAVETACTAFDLPGVNERNVAKALQILMNKSGIYGMIGGQVVDVLSTGQSVSSDTLTFIYQLKTGALMEAALMIGAVLAGADEDQVNLMSSLASDVGMAFQIQDDILDETGNQEDIGKPLHSDAKNEKTTYVTLHGISEAKAEVERLSNRAVETLHGLGKNDEFLTALLLSLVNRDK